MLLKFILKSGIFSRYFNKYCILCGKINDINHLFVSCDNIGVNKWKDTYIKKLTDCLSEEEIKKVDSTNIHNIVVYLFLIWY